MGDVGTEPRLTLCGSHRKRLKTPAFSRRQNSRRSWRNSSEPYKTMVITVACLGLRVCELLGLQWGDIDFENLTVKIQRSIVEGEVNETKTEASESTLPLDPDLAEVSVSSQGGKSLLGRFGLCLCGGQRESHLGRMAYLPIT